MKQILAILLIGVSAMANSAFAQRVSVNYGQIVWGQLNLTSTVGYEDQTGDLVSISIIRYDTTFTDDGKVESVNAKDFLVKVNKDDFKRIKSINKAFWVHAKWVVKKNGIWMETKPPKDPNKPGKKICLVFQFGIIESMNVSKKMEPVKSAANASSDDPCPKTPCPKGKVRNPQTCDCEPESDR